MSLIQYLTRIQFDFGAIALLRDEVLRLGARRPLMITDPGIAVSGIAERVLRAVGAKRTVCYSDTTENP